MKWNISKSVSPCAKVPLANLLKDQLNDKEVARVTEHLDQCEDCQRRLTELSAEANWWREAGQWLENDLPDEGPSEDWGRDEFEEHPGPTPEVALTQSGLMHPSNDPERIGTIGRYAVRRVVGTGGTGIVLQAVDTELNRVVAIKVLAPSFAFNGPARRRFAREGQAAAAVVHENVVAIHHVESNGPVPFLVMQFVDGSSLQELVIRSGPLDAISTLRVISQLASALDVAHSQGLVHRDVKPANVLVGAAGLRVWITDFGLARAVDDASLTRTGFIAGTPHYMSPEQARGETVGAGSDLFGLGSVMYFALTGRPPFCAERSLAILNRICNEKHRPLREVNPDVPNAVAAVVDRLLEKDPSARFHSAKEVHEVCLRLLSDPKTIQVKPALIIVPQKRKRSRTQILVGLLTLLFLLTGAWTWQTFKTYGANVRQTAANSNRTSNSPPIAKAVPPSRADSRSKAGSISNASSQRTIWNLPKDDFKPGQSRPSIASLGLASPIPSVGITNNIASSQVAEQPLTEQRVWQENFDALDGELQRMHVEWSQQLLPAMNESGTSAVQDRFDEARLRSEALLNQLETPANASTPQTNYGSY